MNKNKFTYQLFVVLITYLQGLNKNKLSQIKKIIHTRKKKSLNLKHRM
jgi:hypothetical protein